MQIQVEDISGIWYTGRREIKANSGRTISDPDIKRICELIALGGVESSDEGITANEGICTTELSAEARAKAEAQQEVYR
ncbi:MAG: hypothetical protein AAF662_09390 [Pseudomonadota bacterium]